MIFLDIEEGPRVRGFVSTLLFVGSNPSNPRIVLSDMTCITILALYYIVLHINDRAYV